MGKILKCCTLASLVALYILFPVRCWCKEDTYKRVDTSDCRVCEEDELKRFDDSDYDSFVSLMGRRSAPPPNRVNIWADLLDRKTRIPRPCAQDCLETQRGRFVKHRKQRSQRFL